MDGTVLVADDDRTIRTVLTQALTRAGCKVHATSSLTTLMRWVAEGKGDVVITDVVMPDGNGLEMLPKIAIDRPGMPVIVISAQNTIMTAIQAAEAEAYDYLPKPFDLSELTNVVHRALSVSRNSSDTARKNTEGAEQLPLIGQSPAMQEIYRTLARLMQTDLTVMITGESGTGKELIAEAIHAQSNRAKKPLIKVNCAAFVESLLMSELFGHEKGAFTGAVKTTEGKIENAAGGTLFLDEVGDIPLPLQVKLLRFLQERTIERIGGRTQIAVDTRIVCATHQNVEAMCAEGTFREDLFYRLAEIVVKIPALAERHGDATLLAKAFLKRYANEMNPQITGFASDALAAIDSHDWPGNVRELENRVKRAVIMSDGKLVGAGDLDLQESGEDRADVLNIKSAREEADRRVIRHALARSEGNISNTAKMLGISRPTLYDLLKQYDLSA